MISYIIGWWRHRNHVTNTTHIVLLCYLIVDCFRHVFVSPLWVNFVRLKTEVNAINWQKVISCSCCLGWRVLLWTSEVKNSDVEKCDLIWYFWIEGSLMRSCCQLQFSTLRKITKEYFYRKVLTKKSSDLKESTSLLKLNTLFKSHSL